MVSVCLFLVAVIVVSLVPSSEAVVCYECQYTNVPGVASVGNECDDAFSATPTTWTGATCNGTCTKIKQSAGGVKATYRGCATGNSALGCNSFSAYGTSSADCTCDTDYCNGYAKMAPSLLALVLALISQV